MGLGMDFVGYHGLTLYQLVCLGMTGDLGMVGWIHVMGAVFWLYLAFFFWGGLADSLDGVDLMMFLGLQSCFDSIFVAAG